MNPNRWLMISSLMSVLLFVFHLTSDIMLGFEPGGAQNLVGGTLISLVWLCGTLLLSGRPSGYIITLLGAVLAAGVAYLHMSGAGLGGEFAKTRSGAFFFIWTLQMLGLTGTFSFILAVRGLRRREWAQPR